MKLHLIVPRFETSVNDLYDDRQGVIVQFNTGFKYLESDGDLPSYFSLFILGFGIGISWNYQEWL